MDKDIQKRFPADTDLSYLTFLNDKKLDSELYAYLQSISYADDSKRTVVYKSSLPVQAEICKKIRVKSAKTYREHLKYLMERGFVEEEDDCYVLPNQERMFLMIPLETLGFLLDTLQEHVIKVYIYLG